MTVNYSLLTLLVVCNDNNYYFDIPILDLYTLLLMNTTSRRGVDNGAAGAAVAAPIICLVVVLHK